MKFSWFSGIGDNGTRVFFVLHGTPINLCCSNFPLFVSTALGGGGGTGNKGTCISAGNKIIPG